MFKKLKGYLSVALTLCLPSLAFAQNSESSVPRDFETWTSVALDFELNKRWNIELEEQLRLKENSSTVDAYFTQMSLTYETKSNFGLAGGFRYKNVNDNKGKIQGYKKEFRYHFDASYKHKLEAFSVKYRVRYQSKNDIGTENNSERLAKQVFRFKASLGYNIKKWKLDPKVSGELFRPFKKEEFANFSKYRLSLGTTYKLKNAGEMDFFYRLEKEMDKVEFPKTVHILGLGYKYIIRK